MKNKTFKLGLLCITPGAMDAIHPEDIKSCLLRHSRGDWGDLCEEDKAENELALKEGLRILSAYQDRQGEKFWVITEADRSATTVLLPSEY